ncbi:MAG: hypothetical protein ACPLXS_01650 [Candidatus Micrarchaeales archaeon]
MSFSLIISGFFILLAILAFALAKLREEKIRIIEPIAKESLEERKKKIIEKARKLENLFAKKVIIRIDELKTYDIEALYALKEEGFEIEDGFLIFPNYSKEIKKLIKEREAYDYYLKEGLLKKKLKKK